ncbi:NAD(P)H pyrophosphatase NUDT13, mitochondrial-like [Saccoglossus kowalevskii]
MLISMFRGIISSLKKPCQCKVDKRFSSFVERSRYIESVKANDDTYYEAINCTNSRFILFHGSSVLLDRKAEKYAVNLKSSEEIQSFTADLPNSAIVLNSNHGDQNDNSLTFALSVPNTKEFDKRNLEKELGGTFATSYVRWHDGHQYCPKCGNKTNRSTSGSNRKCDDCNIIHFPKASPVVVTVVHHGNQCLLVRQPQFPEGMYSAVAGYCDIGNSGYK